MFFFLFLNLNLKNNSQFKCQFMVYVGFSLHGSRMVASLCSLSHSVVISMVSLCFRLQRVASQPLGSSGDERSYTASETSCISGSLFCPSAVFPWCSSSVLAGLCLKWPSILRYFASESLNPLSRRQPVMVLWKMWATHGICTNGSCLAAATMVQALPVPIVVTFCWTPQASATKRNCSAQFSAQCLVAIFCTFRRKT